MPLFDMPSNVQDPELTARKRRIEDLLKQDANDFQQPPLKNLGDVSGDSESSPLSPLAHRPVGMSRDPLADERSEENLFALGTTPLQGTPALTAAGSSPMEVDSPSPSSKPNMDRAQAHALSPSRPSGVTSAPSSQPASTPSASASGEPPAKKRKRLTEEEKKAKAETEAAKKQEKEALQAKADEEKRQKQEERDKKKREKEEADELKSKQKAEKAAEKAEKDAEKRQRAEEKDRKKREKEEEEAKKSRSQMRLTAMFISKPSTADADTKVECHDNRNPATSSADAKSKPKTEELTYYATHFRPFFVKERVSLAKSGHQMDEEALRVKARVIDEYVAGTEQFELGPFKPVEVFGLPFALPPRGRVYPSVREIMTKHSGPPRNPIDLTTEEENTRIRQMRRDLRMVPVKSFKFREDVRPPYIGTVSSLPAGVTSLRKIGRNPVSRKVLPLDYGYDSEAEWQEEDGEDLDDGDDDDEDLEEENDMDDFLDDAEDVSPIRQLFHGGIEPTCIGPCWENGRGVGPEPGLDKFRMGFILGNSSLSPNHRFKYMLTFFSLSVAESLLSTQEIDPFSTKYWEPVPKRIASPAPGRDPSTTTSKKSSKKAEVDSGSADPTAASASSGMAPPPAPTDAFHALRGSGAGSRRAQQGLPADLLDKLKDLVRTNPTLSKVGVVELFSAQTSNCTKAQIKVSFEAITEKGPGRTWKIKGDA